MLDREHPSQLRARAKSWCFFTILSVIALACVSCSNASQQASSSRGGTVQPPHITEGGRMALTDSVPPQEDITPTVSVSAPTPPRVPATAHPTPIPLTLQIIAIDDRVVGTGLNQLNYVGGGWKHCTGGCGGDPQYPSS